MLLQKIEEAFACAREIRRRGERAREIRERELFFTIVSGFNLLRLRENICTVLCRKLLWWWWEEEEDVCGKEPTRERRARRTRTDEERLTTSSRKNRRREDHSAPSWARPTWWLWRISIESCWRRKDIGKGSQQEWQGEIKQITIEGCHKSWGWSNVGRDKRFKLWRSCEVKREI